MQRQTDCCQEELWRSFVSALLLSWGEDWQQVTGFYKEMGGVDMATRQTVSLSAVVLGSHGLKLVDPLLGVALADLAQRFVLVSAGSDVLGVQHVVLSLLGVVSGFGQLRAQSLSRGKSRRTGR